MACWSRKARGGSPVCTCISATTQCIYTERRCKWRESGGGVIVLVCILVLFPLCNWNSSCFRRKRNRCTQVYDTAYAVTSVSVLRLGLVQRFPTMQLRPTTGEGRGRRGFLVTRIVFNRCTFRSNMLHDHPCIFDRSLDIDI